MHDRTRLYLAAFVRALATGLIGVLLALHLARAGLDGSAIGLVLTSGLAGATLAVALVTYGGDRLGKRRLLLVLSFAAGCGGLAIACAASPLALAGVALLGMVNGQGRDRGAALVLEQSALPATSEDAVRTSVFARYNLLQDVGHALGGLLAMLPEVLRNLWGLDAGLASQIAILVYGGLHWVAAACYWGLSERIETPQASGGAQWRTLAPASRNVLWRISGLFGIDSLAGGFLGSALVALFFFERFQVEETTLALLFVAARLLNALSHLGAAWLAQRIGLVNTMVFTHLPSSLLLMSVAVAPNFPVAAVLYLLREGLVEMDVPTRQSYLMAVVRPSERTFASGVTHLVRLGGWAAGPAFAGLLIETLGLGSPLLVGATMKIAYDLLLWRAFRHLKPPEER